MNWIELNWIELNWIELNWIQWIQLNCIEFNWIQLTYESFLYYHDYCNYSVDIMSITRNMLNGFNVETTRFLLTWFRIRYTEISPSKIFLSKNTTVYTRYIQDAAWVKTDCFTFWLHFGVYYIWITLNIPTRWSNVSKWNKTRWDEAKSLRMFISPSRECIFVTLNYLLLKYQDALNDTTQWHWAFLNYIMWHWTFNDAHLYISAFCSSN